MNVLQRAAAPTPRFFKKLRLIGLLLTTASSVLLGGDFVSENLLEIVKQIAGAGAVLTAVSQITVDESALNLTEKKQLRDGP